MELESSLTARVDDSVTFRYEVENTSSEPATFRFRSGKRIDLTVREVETEEIAWEWGAGRMFTQAIEEETLAGGERIEQEFTWAEPPAGEYVASATLETVGDSDARATTEFSVQTDM